jgi:hypothetical protein
MLNNIFHKGMPLLDCMTTCTLVPVYKGRGDRGLASSYRGVAVSSAIYKLYAAVLNRRLDTYCDTNQLRALTQCGFRKGHSTHTAIFTLQHVIHHRCAARPNHQPQPLHVCFIDFTKAFDSINMTKLWIRLQQLGVGDRLLKAIQDIYRHTPMTVKVNGEKHPNCIAPQKGGKQGCPLSPLLFGLVIEQLHSKLNSSNSHLACAWL